MKINKIIQSIQKADQDFQLIEPNDRIAVGLSGGKDSMVLLTALSRLQKFYAIPFEIVAIHLKMGFDNMETAQIQAYCIDHEIEYQEEATLIAETLRKYEKNNKLSCSRCSKYKKACMSAAAIKYNCNKIAYGHNSNDAVETLFMNMIFGGRIAVFEPKIELSKSQLQLIRPMIYVDEKEIQTCASQLNLPILANTCPNDKNSERARVKKIIEDLYAVYPIAEKNFIQMLSNEEFVRLWHKTKQK